MLFPGIGANTTNTQYLEKGFVMKVSFPPLSFSNQFYLSCLVRTSEHPLFLLLSKDQGNTACNFSEDFIKGYLM